VKCLDDKQKKTMYSRLVYIPTTDDSKKASASVINSVILLQAKQACTILTFRV